MTEKPAVLITRNLPPIVLSRLGQSFDARPNRDDRLFDAREIVARSRECDAILCCSSEKFTAALIEALPPRVRALATYSVGVEHIDLEAARRRGLIVTNTPEVLTDSTADIAMLLLLAAARRAYEGDRMLREDRWTGWTPSQLVGVHVTGKRLGILGMGRIGAAVARRARGFDMTIHYSNRNRLPPDREGGAIFHPDPEDLLAVSDFLSIHCPASPETHRFLNRRRIQCLPDGAVVVNAARGSIVDDEALIAALESGKLAAAGLDVFDGEPRIHPGYRKLANVFILPHLGSATVETRNTMGFKCCDNLEAIFAGRPPPDRVV